MLEIHKGRFCRPYENSFFREFTESMENCFQTRKLNGLLLGSPLCESDRTLQMDVLLITSGAICVIDFKKYTGKVTLPESSDFDHGQWINNDTITVKGGSGNKNPFMQLSVQKKKLEKVIKKLITPNLSSSETIDTRHIKRVVCFQGSVSVEGTIPGEVSRDFYIADRSNYLEVIGDIVDVETSEIILTDNGLHHFNQLFKTVDASEYLTNSELYKSFDKQVGNLSLDQQTVLKHFNEWLAQPGKQIFILQGTSNSGKSHIIKYLQSRIALTSPANTIKLTHSNRVASYLNNLDPFGEWKSLFSHIYNLDETETLDNQKLPAGELEQDMEENEESNSQNSRITTQILPLKESLDDRDMVYIVDEAQLVTNNLVQTEFLRFGSGQLLNDFLKFADLESTDRRIVFIGDRFQYVNQGSALTAVRLESSSMIHENKLEVYSLLDKPAFSQLTGEFLKCTDAISSGRFSSLVLEEGESLARITQAEMFTTLDKEALASNRLHLLTMQRRSAKQVNLRIKEEIMATGKELSVDDMIVLHNSVEALCQPDAAYKTKYLSSWTFARVECLSPLSEPRTQIINDVIVVLRLREIRIKPVTGDDERYTIYSLENYRERGKVTQEEQRAIRVLMEIEKSKAVKAFPFIQSLEYQELISNELIHRLHDNDKVFVENLVAGKRLKHNLSQEEMDALEMVKNAKKQFRASSTRMLNADQDSEYFKLKNLAHLDYGWAFTVHKTAPLKWDEVILIDDYYANKSSEDYYRLIYTGLSRATRRARIVDFKKLSPWQHTQFSDKSHNSTERPGLMLVDAESTEQIVVAIKKSLISAANCAGLLIENIKESSYQLTLIVSLGNESARVRIYYDSRGKVNEPVVDRASSEVFDVQVKHTIGSVPALSDLSFLKDEWRAEEYERLSNNLNDYGMALTGIKQYPYQDRLLFASARGKLLVQVFHTGVSTFSQVTALFCDDTDDWVAFQAAVKGDIDS